MLKKRHSNKPKPFGQRLSGPEERRFQGSIHTPTYAQACSTQSNGFLATIESK